MSHSTCTAKSRACSDCHRDAVHTVVGGSPGVPTMDGCLACHATIQRSEGCELCHVGKGETKGATPWSVTHGPKWKLTHGAGDLTTCGFCHTTGTGCSDCHAMMPHPDGWAKTHGTGVDASRKNCVTCHTNAFCDGCHGMPMPHPTGWLKAHTTDTKDRKDPLCARCHLSEDCDACHLAHTHPGRIRGKVTPRG